jgi:hypothetical protein
MEFKKLQNLVELDLSNCSYLGVYLIQVCTCHNSKHFDDPSATNCKHCEPLMCFFFFCYWSKALFKFYNLKGPLINIDRVIEP